MWRRFFPLHAIVLLCVERLHAETIALGWQHTCVVSSTGGVRCWGAGTLGQLGDGTSVNRFTVPAVDVLNIASVASISGGRDHVCALSTSSGLRW